MRGNRQFKVDANHKAVVEALRAAGISVQSLAVVGKGCPDLLCGFHGINVILELKDGHAAPSKRQCTLDEKKFAFAWKGQWDLAQSAEQAIQIVHRCVAEAGK